MLPQPEAIFHTVFLLDRSLHLYTTPPQQSLALDMFWSPSGHALKNTYHHLMQSEIIKDFYIISIISGEGGI